jgi:hypothetical protein
METAKSRKDLFDKTLKNQGLNNLYAIEQFKVGDYFADVLFEFNERIYCVDIIWWDDSGEPIERIPTKEEIDQTVKNLNNDSEIWELIPEESFDRWDYEEDYIMAKYKGY